MTIEQFNKTGFRYGDKFRYRDGNVYEGTAVDFDEALIGLKMNLQGGEEGDINWVRCENVERV